MVESLAPAAVVSKAAGTDLLTRPLTAIEHVDSLQLVDAAVRWGGAHPYQQPGFVLAAAKAGRRSPAAIELRSAGGELRGYWLAYEFDRALGPLRVPVVWARGLPVVEPELRDDPDVIRRFVEALLDSTRSASRLAVMVTTEPGTNAGVESTLAGLGFDRQDLSSVVIDLAASEEELLAGLNRSDRWNVKRAMRENVTLTESVEVANFETLAGMVDRTYDSGGVAYRLPIEEFQAYRELSLSGGGRLTMATVDGQVAGATFEVILGDRSITHLWTTNDLGRKLRVGDLMVWETMRRCKADGLRWFDLGTIKTQPEEGSKAAGIYHFKTKWGGVQTLTPFYRRAGALDRLIQTLRRWRDGSQG